MKNDVFVELRLLSGMKGKKDFSKTAKDDTLHVKQIIISFRRVECDLRWLGFCSHEK